jgi:hypothetical protein
VGDSTVWVAGDDQIAYISTFPDTFTQRSAANTGLSALHANYKVFAMAGSPTHMYFSAWRDDASTYGKRVTLRQSQATAASETVVAETTNKPPFAGMAWLNGMLYGWTGSNLIQHDVSALPATGAEIVTVYPSGVDLPASSLYQGVWWAECVATENSIVMFFAMDGFSQVFEWKNGVGRPIWRAPQGFTIKGSCYSNGVMYFAGHWGGEGNATGWGALYALPLDSYNPIKLKEIRKLNNNHLAMQSIIPSYGYQIMPIAESGGLIFVYDAETDGLTMLDDLGTDADGDPDGVVYVPGTARMNSGVVFGSYRYFPTFIAGGSGAGNYKIISYDDDEPDQRETGMLTGSSDYSLYAGYFESSAWDYDYPMERKNLIGFHLVFKPLAAGQTLDVSYDATDNPDSPSFTALTQITSATSGASTGRVFIPVSTSSNTVKFFRLKFRVKLQSTSGVKTPILYSVTAEAGLVRKREEWDIVVRLKDEPSRNRPTDRKVRGSKLRDWIEATVESGSVVAFRDGYRYGDSERYGTPYSSHSVIIKQAEDMIDKPGEGSMRLLLREVTPAT